MKARVKQTGKIIDIVKIDYLESDTVILMVFHTEDGYSDSYIFKSLKELNDTLEGYLPKEPLIKDERIRRAVRAWAKIGKYEHIYYDRAYNRLADDCDFVHCIEFAIDPCPDAENECSYTITELCGEEE